MAGLAKLAALLHVDQDDLRAAIEQVIDEREERAADMEALAHNSALDSISDNYGGGE